MFRATLLSMLTVVTVVANVQSLGIGTEGDPAPGRSPGPPKPARRHQVTSSATVVTEEEEEEVEDSVGVTEEQGLLTGCGLHGKVVAVGDDDERAMFGVGVEHGLFRTEVLVKDVVYDVVINQLSKDLTDNNHHNQQPVDFSITSLIDGIPTGEFVEGLSTPAEIASSTTITTTITNGDNKELGPCELPWHTYEGSLKIQDDSGPSKTSEKERSGNTDVVLKWRTSELNTVGDYRLNITFVFRYRYNHSEIIYEKHFRKEISNDCQFWLNHDEGNISWHNLPPHHKDCRVWFPKHISTGHGLVIDLSRLNVPCTKGHLHFVGLNTTQPRPSPRTTNTHLCGKLEELPDADRHLYFPATETTTPCLLIHGHPIFEFKYHLVDYCYNVTFTTRNGTFNLQPSGDLQCTFRIHLPYGNRVAMTLLLGDASVTATGVPQDSVLGPVTTASSLGCAAGIFTEFLDGDSNTWAQCTRAGDAQRQIEVVSRENRVVLRVSVRSLSSAGLGMRMWYRAETVEEVVGVCGFGWVAVRQFCVAAVEAARLPWAQAEMECARRGGHLASVRNEQAQEVIDKLLINSPGNSEHSAYWIGASDKTHEGDFHWTDGLPFSYTNWFPGWSQHNDYNKQPNDDGLSEQDCVEVRRSYALPSSSASVANNYMWNDRDCATPNYFICEKLQNNEPLEENWPPDCNRSLMLSRNQPRATVSSPGFPRLYPDNANCDTHISAPAGYRIVLDFEELVLESEPSCSYDYLEIIESESNNNTTETHKENRKLCGDWSAKLKLLRHVSHGSKIKLRFNSDYSHHYGGYKARVSMEIATECSDDRLQMFNHSCYLFVSYPEVTWGTAQQICRGVRAQLTSILSPNEEKFVTSSIRKMSEYRTSDRYWLGAKSDGHGKYSWTDHSEMSYTGWLPGYKPSETGKSGHLCLGMLWTASPTPMLPSGLYWRAQKCEQVGGYVCKRQLMTPQSGLNFNKTINGSEGKITTPNYPGNYYNNLDFSVRITGPERTRIVLQFLKIDLESQIECLYDYIQIKSPGRHNADLTKLCGTHENDMDRYNFVSFGHEVEILFHSDYSISGAGFSLTWQAVDTSACPSHTLTAKEDSITSPNYPKFLLANLDCTFSIIAPVGKRIWIDFEDFEILSEESSLEITIGRNLEKLHPYKSNDLLSDGSFLSEAEQLVVRLVTKDKPKGRGFKAIYRTVATPIHAEKTISLTNNSYGSLLHLNYPSKIAHNVDFLQHLVAPPGWTISLELFQVRLSESPCVQHIEVYDNYADENGTSWHLCYDAEEIDAIVPRAPIAITSFLNTLYLRQRNLLTGMALNVSLRVHEDVNYRAKLLRHRTEVVESCKPNPCLHGAKCIANNGQNYCQCLKYYTGIFCTLTLCDLDPCLFGTCHLTNNSFKCQCRTGYSGPTCDQKRRPCEGNPCESRGTCLEKGDSFVCQCHAWWKGNRCQDRMVHIPYKPLSERMLREPFWLGLMTVSVVMGVIGLFWCAKRHFPEKIEKLLAEEDDRNRSTISSLRSASVREQLAASGNTAVTTAAGTPSTGGGGGGGPALPRSLFGRLGIRKPSLLSLTSPHASVASCGGGGYSPATARTFSLDDLLKPPPRRTPSPKKKRNNSTPTKKNAAEKKQILQQLVGPSGKQHSRKVSLGELMLMTDRKKDIPGTSRDGSTRETMFSCESAVAAAAVSSAQITLSDPKLEKKVTFARLLSKVSQEMSSGSELELGIMQANRLSYATAFAPISTPPSPATNRRHSPNSTSSNQGSDSLTTSYCSDLPALSSSVSDLHRRNGSATSNGYNTNTTSFKQKPSSADSILAMFRNFSSSSAGVNLSSSLKVSPSTTPTASTPQDDVAGDDETSTSSIHTTPISFESPHHHNNTIEVSVLDSLSAHKSSNFLHPPTILLEIPSTINKCLSPIRELPTPLPSPAVTPYMRRSTATSSIEDMDLISDDRISVEMSTNISISDGEMDEEVHSKQDIAIDPQGEDGLILEEVAAMQSIPQIPVFNSMARPMTLGQSLSLPLPIPIINISVLPSPENPYPPNIPLVIPTLTIQTPSPTHHPRPNILLPGSPPPRSPPEHNQFHFPTQNTTFKPFQRRALKEFDKPTSLDLPYAPPMITVTCNMSEVESDVDSISPNKNKTSLGPPSGMSYLSPFSMVTRGDHMQSESNLSSSGYSSMASPGPSRCGSSNPLCPSEMEDPPGPSSHHHSVLVRRPSPLLKNNSASNSNQPNQQRGRSDSETLSDDPLLESNDEGIGTDHLEEKIDDGELKSAKELEIYICTDTVVDPPETSVIVDIEESPSVSVELDRLIPPPPTIKKSLQLPSIVVNSDSNLSYLSPISSRSESPLSDKTQGGINRFSSQFYGRHKDLLPFTDSDGLYDFPSSDKVNITTAPRKAGRKREKKTTTFRNAKTPSPTKSTAPNCYHLELPTKIGAPRKLSPKRRSRTQQQQIASSSSSSSDSIVSAREYRLSSSSPSPDTIRWSASLEWPDAKKSPEASDEDTADEVRLSMLQKPEQEFPKSKKINKLRAISHQIRFLRRLELSLKRRDRVVSPAESVDSGGEDESPRASSPLLKTTTSADSESNNHHTASEQLLRKSQSSGKLMQTAATNKGLAMRRNRLQRADYLPPTDERYWKRVVITGNTGHSD